MVGLDRAAVGVGWGMGGGLPRRWFSDGGQGI